MCDLHHVIHINHNLRLYSTRRCLRFALAIKPNVCNADDYIYILYVILIKVRYIWGLFL